jgi:hypothetical protein
MANLDFQLEWIEGCVYGRLQRQLDHAGSDLVNGLIH